MPRLPDLTYENLSPQQRQVHDAIVAGPRGRVEGPLKVWLRSPGLATPAQELGAFCRYGTSLPKRLSELAILITGAFWKAGFEWHVHAPIAIEAGLDREAVEAIRTGKRPALSRPDEAAVYEFASALLRRRRVSNAVYRRAVSELGDLATVELVGVLGYYGFISMTIVAFEVPAPEGAAEPFAG
jgi:4-carboxymuconolactone decarboxylase